jgi:hypothetical protein
LAYNPGERLTVAVFSTMGPTGDIGANYSSGVFLRLAKLLTPDTVPPVQVEPRGKSGNK